MTDPFTEECFVEHGIVAHLRDGRVVAYGNYTLVIAAAGNVAVNVRLPDLKYVEHVIHLQFDVDPLVDPGTPVNKQIIGNVVGLTLVGVGGGTTLTLEITGVGPP